MKTIIKYLFTALLLPLLCGCADFLDVNPKGEVFDKDMFETAEGYEDALYGIYAELGTTQYLYADYLMWVPETLCANVWVSDNALEFMALAQWDRYLATDITRGIWSAVYQTINHLNNILSHIDEGGEDQFRYSRLYKGEALALRALLHFELLRLFGAPVWASAADKARAIPYVTRYTFDITPFSSYDEACEQILADLREAERCLAEDETLLPAVRDNSPSGGFASCRIIHMNLYAVQALTARVYWTRNELDKAAVYARKVIESGKFSFRGVPAFTQPDNGTLDLNETIFGVYSKEAQTRNARKYGLTQQAGSGFQLNSAYKALYEAGMTSQRDYRLAAWFNDGESLLIKLVNPAYYSSGQSYLGKSILGVNLLRLPEMYYIVAESLLESDPKTATEYFDAVITTRGRDAFSEQGFTLTADELYDERCREYFGEGLQWHDMKRQGKDIALSGGGSLSGSDINTYKIPYPRSEDENRDETSKND